MDEIKRILQDITTRLEKLERYSNNIVSFSTRPMFIASFSSGTIGPGNVMVWNNEWIDTASNYNPSTGIFTASVAGQYAFGFNILLPNAGAGEFRFEFYKNNALHNGIIQQKIAGAWQTIEGVCLITLAVNDTVKINYTTGTGNAYMDQNYDRFWGFLVG